MVVYVVAFLVDDSCDRNSSNHLEDKEEEAVT